MSPVEPEIADHERDQAAQPDRPLANLVVHAPGDQVIAGIGGDAQGRCQQQRGHDATDEVEAQITKHHLAEDRRRTDREKSLQWQKDDGKQHQPDALPQHVHQSRDHILLVQECGQWDVFLSG
jgi:hypothetical protein